MSARLVTIPISHFCEKARWGLDRAAVDFVELPHLQLIHVLAARTAGGGRTVPVFVTDAGEVLADSPDILRWADTRIDPERRLYPDGELGVEAAALEAWLDDGLGPDGRLWMYHETLPVVRDLQHWALAGVPRWERFVFRASGPAVGVAIRRYLRIDTASAAAALERIDRVFDDIARRLSDGRAFLFGRPIHGRGPHLRRLIGTGTASRSVWIPAAAARGDARPNGPGGAALTHSSGGGVRGPPLPGAPRRASRIRLA